jgi:CubicO group peptidase (beta-lactamase class C family)
VHDDFSVADAIVSDFFGRGGQPAISYGIVRDGALAHAAGFGSRVLGGPPPDQDTVLRIASMSKSFTASAVLLLRDEGRLALDDPAEKYVPELAGWPLVTADCDRVSIRHLLTMTAGFPTDDPWGDRQQGLPLREFGALLARGVSVNWAPGTRFEYSNMGYAILGLVIAAASGMEYASFVRTRLLEPLGLTRTGFAAHEFGPDVLAVGYRRGMAGWEELPFDPYGAFAPMGGVFSSVTDLARWVAGFASDTPGHPLRGGARREMQLPQAVTGWRVQERLPGGGPAAPAYYGFGLFVDEDAAAGRVVSHSGGYPGFGSNMRWHPATGFGVIALGNATYAAMSVLTALVFDALLPRSCARHVALAPSSHVTTSHVTTSHVTTSHVTGSDQQTPWPRTLTARDAVDGLLRSWDDAVAYSLFSENVALDSPYQERRVTLDLIRERIGDFAPSSTRPAESDTPAHRRWWLTGERGTVQVQIQLTPEREPRVQSLTIAVPPAAGSPLAQALDSLLAWMNDGAADWPVSVAVAPGVDAALLGRRLRMAAVWTGRAAIAAFCSGDGSSSVSAELAGEHATVILALAVNPAGQLRHVDLTLSS